MFKNFLLFAGTIDYIEGYFTTYNPVGWKGFHGSFDTFVEAYDFYKEWCLTTEDEQEVWGQIVNLETNLITETSAFETRFTIIDLAMVSTTLWELWRNGAITLKQYNLLIRMPGQQLNDFLAYPTKDGLNQLLRSQ